MKFCDKSMLPFFMGFPFLALSVFLILSQHIHASDDSELSGGLVVKVSERLMFISSRFMLHADDSVRDGTVTFWSRPGHNVGAVEHIAIYPVSESAMNYWKADVSQEVEICGFKYKVKSEIVDDTPMALSQLQVSLKSAFVIVLTPNRKYVDHVLSMLCETKID